jgi:hypothetical protein
VRIEEIRKAAGRIEPVLAPGAFQAIAHICQVPDAPDCVTAEGRRTSGRSRHLIT